ncbi:MAG: DUF5682 family protein [Tannerella sp.]|jgi:hypothetical protein|nr:DUF5682 family protein [Tannerella sp.]
MINNCSVFGVRHLSPGAAWHLLRFLEEKNPRCVLVEGPSDATGFMYDIAATNVKPPVALLAYTTGLPVETVMYPFASYSPEYRAICWSVQNRREVRFMDLPSDRMLKLRRERGRDEETQQAQAFYRYHNELYEKLAGHSEEDDYESYWERNFEHNLTAGSYNTVLSYQSEQIREMVAGRELEAAPYDYSCNLIREAYMRREIERAVREGYRPEEIVVVAGAYHVSGIRSGLPAMSDGELKKLDSAQSQVTLMPYSYLRLSSRTGYGAGNRAPYYFEMMWDAMNDGRIGDLPAVYLAKVAQYLRDKGYNASPASTIEAVRLAAALTSLRGGAIPVLKDLHDAAVTCFGGGELSVVAEALNSADTGTATGSLPEGVSRTPVQENMEQELKRLKLTDYKSAVAQELTLDLRENFKVKSREAAFIDLNRSTFLHRLQTLGIHFAGKQHVSQESASWAEKWVLRWTPEVEIEIVEANLKGETIEIAAAYRLKEQLNDCTDVSAAAKIVRLACECRLTDIFENALNTLQRLLVDSAGFTETANAADELSVLIRFGDLRQVNLEPLKPVLRQLFLRASLLLTGASSCDDRAADGISRAVNTLEMISQRQYEFVDVEIWRKELGTLARRDDLNTKLSGTAFSVLLEHNLVSDEDCAKEISRRLSPGVPAVLGAGWFEGLSSRNRYALLSRISLWRELDKYVSQLDDEEFYRSVVFLRRAFGSFEPDRKNSIAELLGEIWGTGEEFTAETLRSELSEQEMEKLDELNDFEF